MSLRTVERVAAGAAVAGAAAQLTVTVSEPDWSGSDVSHAARVVASTTFWDASHLLDLVGMLLTVAALTVVDRRLIRAGSPWPRLGQPFLLLLGAFGGIAVVTGAAMRTTVVGPGHGIGHGIAADLAAFDAVRQTTEDVFFAAFLALGIYMALLSASILSTAEFARWLGWSSGVSALLITTGNVLSIWWASTFVFALAGFALFLVVVLCLGVRLWSLADAQPSPRLGVIEATVV